MKPLAIGVVLALLPAAGIAQDLGQLAREEEKKRQARGAPPAPPKSYTDDDLRKPEPGASPAPAKVGGKKPVPAAAPPPPDEGRREAERDTRSTAEKLNEADWRERGAQRRAAVKAAEQQVKELDAEAGRLLWQSLQSTDTNEILALRAQQQEVLARLEDARASLTAAKAAVEALAAEAARAGAPLGWLREP